MTAKIVRGQFYLDVIELACQDGGVPRWAEIGKPDPRTQIRELYVGEARLELGRRTVERGITRILGGQMLNRPTGVDTVLWRAVGNANSAQDAAMLAVPQADALVQVGLFNFVAFPAVSYA